MNQTESNYSGAEYAESQDSTYLPLSTLSRQLRSYQILMIGVSATIGLGIFVLSGEILQVAGPAGTVVAFGIISLVAIWVMNGIAEMIQIWPVSNPFVEFVQAFVDQDLGTVVGIAYWYAYAMGFQGLLVTAASLTSRWGTSSAIQGTIFYFVCPFLLYCLNYMGVFWLGLVESILGTLKIAFVLAVFILMLVVNQDNSKGSRVGIDYLTDGFKANPEVVDGIIPAICVALPMAAYAFVGIETVAITAYEARGRESLKFPTRYIAWIISLLYIISAFGFVSNVRYCDPQLPRLYDQKKSDSVCPPQQHSRRDNISSISVDTSRQPVSPAVLALAANGHGVAADAITGCMIFVVLSAANAALYVASRALFGLTRGMAADSTRINRIGRRLGFVTEGKKIKIPFGGGREHTFFGKIPAPALVFSVVIFCWIPFIHLSEREGIATLQQILSEMGTVGCFLVWASQALAYIRFNHLRTEYKAVLRHDKRYTEKKSWGQPLWAWLGLIGSLVIVFVLNTATWWNGHVDPIRAVAVFLGPVILLIIWLGLKFYNRRWITPPPDERDFARVVDDLSRKLIESRLNQSVQPLRNGSDGEIAMGTVRVHTGGVDAVSKTNTAEEDEGPREWL